MDRRFFLPLLFVLYVSVGMAAAFLFSSRSGKPFQEERIRVSYSLLAPSGLQDQTSEEDQTLPEEENPREPEETVAIWETPVQEDPAPETPAYTYQVSPIHRRLMIRSGPSLKYKVIGYLYAGDTGDVIDPGSQEDEWVLLTNGEVEGYSFKEYLILTEKEN